MKSLKKSVFIDPYTDFAYKKLFGPDSRSGALMDFLNSVLKLEQPIIEIEFISGEQLGQVKHDRKSVFDIHCMDQEGNYIIVEVQRINKQFFKQRSVFYSTFPVRHQGERGGKWNYQLKKTYTICILDFCFDDTDPDQMVHKVKLIDEDTQRVFCDVLMYWYIEMPKFKKTEKELITREDKWFYVLNNLTKFSEIPISLSEDTVFKLFFMDARQAHLTELELMAYYASKKAEWDEFAEKETAVNEGLALGLAKGITQGISQGITQGISQGILITAENMLKKNTDIQLIHEYTGISIEEIKLLAEKIIE